MDDYQRRAIQLLEALHSGQQELRREHLEDLKEARRTREWLAFGVIVLALNFSALVVALALPGPQL